MTATLPSIPFFFIFPYAIPFIIALKMPGWRSVLAFAVIGCGAAALVLVDIAGDGSLGAALLLPFVWAWAIGVAGGVATRAVMLSLKVAREGHSLLRIGVVTLGFAALPSVVYGLLWQHAWKRRLPSEACLRAEFDIELAGTLYRLPAAPMFAVYTDRRGTDAYYLNINSFLREFCGKAKASSGPVRTTAVSLRFDEMQRSGQPLVLSFCRAWEEVRWWAEELCRPRMNLDALHWPINAVVYSAAGYDHRHMLASGAPHTTRDRFLEAWAKAEANGNPPAVERVGPFERFDFHERHPYSFLVASADGADAWLTPSGEPHTFFCPGSTHEGRPTGTAGCSTDYQLHGDLWITYQFRSRSAEIGTTAMAVDRKLRSMLSDLSGAPR